MLLSPQVDFVAVSCLRVVTAHQDPVPLRRRLARHVRCSSACSGGVLVARLHLCILRERLLRRADSTLSPLYPQVPGWRLEQAEGVPCLRQEWKARP